MSNASTQYENADQSLTAVLDGVPAQSWTDPSPCDGWTARDVLRHMIETQREFLTGHAIELGEAPDIDADPAAAWRAHAERVTRAIGEDAVAAIEYDGHFGPTTVGATLEQFYIWDMIVHRWDIARSVGADDGLSDAELDRLDYGADSFGEALYMDGICRPGVEAPVDADRKTRLLARIGRSA